LNRARVVSRCGFEGKQFAATNCARFRKAAWNNGSGKVFAATFCPRAYDYFFRGSPCGTDGLRQRTALGWHAKPMLEQTGAAPSEPREQLTQSSVHWLQFGGPLCTEMSAGAERGGILRSAANEAPAARIAADANRRIKKDRRMCLPFRCLASERYFIVAAMQRVA
jgi:hypothetical protein